MCFNQFKGMLNIIFDRHFIIKVKYRFYSLTLTPLSQFISIPCYVF